MYDVIAQMLFSHQVNVAIRAAYNPAFTADIIMCRINKIPSASNELGKKNIIHQICLLFYF
jgi:hypothetical protein